MTKQRKTALYYGSCPLGPGTRFTATKWYESRDDRHVVLIEFHDERGIKWIGPENSPRTARTLIAREIRTGEKGFEVITATIDAIKGQTDFTVQVTAGTDVSLTPRRLSL